MHLWACAHMHGHFHAQGWHQLLYHLILAAAVCIHLADALFFDCQSELGFSRLSSQQQASSFHDIASNGTSSSFSISSISLALLHITVSCAFKPGYLMNHN